MDDKSLKAIMAELEDIKVRLAGVAMHAGIGSHAGDVAMHAGIKEGYSRIPIGGLIGPVGDPSTGILLDRGKLAQLKVRKLDIQIAETQKVVDFLKMERDLLAEEHKIR